MITKDVLAEKKDLLIKQRDNALAVYQQAVGALLLIENLEPLAKDKESSLTLDELASALGADSAEIVGADTQQP